MRQVRVELARFITRHAIGALLLASALLAVVLVLSVAFDTRPASETERVAAQQSLAQARADAAKAGDSSGERTPVLADFLPRDEIDLGRIADHRGTLLLVVLTGVGVLVGATFSGADWASGALATQLLFRPRRTSVWLTKGIAVVLGTTVAAAVVLVGFWGSLAAIAAARGVGVSTPDWNDLLSTSGRGLALVAAATLGGHALTMLLRHTGLTLGLLFAAAVTGEVLAASLPVERAARWSLQNNLTAWLQGGHRVFDGSTPFVLTAGQAAATLGALLLVAVLLSLAAFRVRDVA